MNNRQPAKPIKICLVITQGDLGGAQHYVFDLATRLPKENFEIYIAAGLEKTELAEALRERDVNMITIPSLRRNIHPLADLRAIKELTAFFRSIKPNIVHLNSSKAGFLGSFAARLAHVPRVIFTAHGFAFLEPNSWFVRKLYFWAEKFASRFRNKIICVSEFDRQAAIRLKLCPPEKLITIHNGIDLPASPTNSPQATPNSPPVIGAIAHLYKTKGLNYLIDAASEVNANFEIIGEGPERANLESQISKLKLQNKFKLPGAEKNAARHLSRFDIFVLPSVKEGFPYVILEAMAAGRPIVATSVGGIPEILTPALSPPYQGGNKKGVGILIPPKNPSALAEAVKFLIANPEVAKRLGENARERVKNFTLEKMLAATSKIYET